MTTDVMDPQELEGATPISRIENCSLSVARRVAAMLDLEPDFLQECKTLPRGWQFVLMAADTRRSALRADGFPGLGVPMPDLGLPRLMLGGRTVTYAKDIPLGAELLRTSALQKLTRKTSAAGPMAIATLAHEMRMPGEDSAALTETQTYLLLPARKGALEGSAVAQSQVPTGEYKKSFTPDETLLFQFSSLGFNSHRIHIDRSHARNVEGFPDLVVNGGLLTLLLTEFLRCDLNVSPAALKVRHVAPLYCGRAITMTADRDGAGWRLKTYDDRNVLAVEMEVETQ